MGRRGRSGALVYKCCRREGRKDVRRMKEIGRMEKVRKGDEGKKAGGDRKEGR